MSFRAKFFRARSAQSEVVSVHVENGFLQVRNVEGVLASWPVASIHRDPTHSVAVVLACGSDDERLELLDTAILAQLNIQAPVWNLASLRDKAYYFWICGLLSAGVITLIIWNVGTAARILAAKVPLEYETKLAEAALVGGGIKACSPSDRQTEVVRKLTERLFEGDPEGATRVSIHFVDEDVKNAYTFPGGGIYFFTGLIRGMESPDEFAGVLAHEIEHAVRRHVLQSVIKGLVFTGMINFIFGDFSAIALIDPSTAIQLLTLKHSREMEAEADQGAVQRLKASGLSPRGLVQFFKREDDGKLAKKLSFLSTHPYSGKRANAFEKLVEDNDEYLSPALDDDDWEQVKAVCTTSL